jgi:hypothetical protein
MTLTDIDPTAAHVVPNGDLIDHELSVLCVCGPNLDTERPSGTQPCECGCTSPAAPMVWVHHSLDGREHHET